MEMRRGEGRERKRMIGEGEVERLRELSENWKL
jgi:hypothetical protein